MFKGMKMAIQIYNGSLTVKLKFCAWQVSLLNPQHLFCKHSEVFINHNNLGHRKVLQ